MSHRVRSSDPSVAQPIAGGGTPPARKTDPNTVVGGARDAFIPSDTNPDVGKIGTPPVATRAWGDRIDPTLKRHMTEVLIRALGLTLAQIDEPNADEGQPPTGSRTV